MVTYVRRVFLFLYNLGFEHSEDYDLDCEVRLEFALNDTYQCHNYSITDDTRCELEEREKIEIFKVLIALITSDVPFLRVESSHSTATVHINDTDEPECSKLSLLL